MSDTLEITENTLFVSDAVLSTLAENLLIAVAQLTNAEGLRVCVTAFPPSAKAHALRAIQAVSGYDVATVGSITELTKESAE